jgi:hypothetical protein
MRSRCTRLLVSGIALVALAGLLMTEPSIPSEAAAGKTLVTGSLRIFGGTAFTPRSGEPVAGRVVFKPAQGAARVLRVGKSGHFKIALEPGTYTSFGGPQAWRNECLVDGGRPFKVEAHRRIRVVVACVAL